MGVITVAVVIVVVIAVARAARGKGNVRRGNLPKTTGRRRREVKGMIKNGIEIEERGRVRRKVRRKRIRRRDLVKAAAVVAAILKVQNPTKARLKPEE